MPKKIAILGLGWLGLPLAKVLFEKGYDITGSTTSSQKLMNLLKSHFSVRIIKVSKNNVSGDWKNFVKDTSVLIINIPPGRKTNEESHYAKKIEQIVMRCDPSLKVIFVSSTSVYGNHNQNVNEESETIPTRASGNAVLEAEQIVQKHFGDNVTIIRFAGLYGKNRHPGRFLKPNNPIPNPNGKINLIHLDDCTKMISAIIEQDCFGEIFNGCSDQHPIRSEFYSKAAFSLSLDPLEFDAEEAPVGKVVCNVKSKEKLGLDYVNPMHFFDAK